jgi:chromosome segregation ATPase
LVIALLAAQFASGCVVSSQELRKVKADFADERQQALAGQQEFEDRLAAIEASLRQLNRSGSSDKQLQSVSKRLSAVESELKKVEKGSALAVQMGLISSVQTESNDQGIAGLRGELEKLGVELQALQQRLLASDKQLESGLVQLREISGKLK